MSETKNPVDEFVEFYGYHPDPINGEDTDMREKMKSDLIKLVESLMPSEEIEDWTVIQPDQTINVPDELYKIVNKTGFQLRFHAISGKGEAETICHIVYNAQKFFTSKLRIEILNKLK
jgi:hypothetical protein